MQLLRADVTVVLGYPHADALPVGKSLSELGFDSLTAVQLRNRLSMALKVRLPVAVVFEHRTAEELTRHLLGMLDDEAVAAATPEPPGAPEIPGAERPTYTLSSLFRTVIAAGQPVAAMHLLVTASWALPTFTAAQGNEHALPPRRRTHGRRAPGGPTIVYFPAYHPSLAPDGGDFPRFHDALQNDRKDLHHPHDLGTLNILEFPHPGIGIGLGAGAAVPEDRAALARTQAESVLRHVGEGSFVIVGRSAGGNVAHLVAHHLEGMGRAPTGLVLLDTYHITPHNSGKDWLLSLAAPPPRETGATDFAGDDDNTLAAVGAYNRIFLDWAPEPVATPTLLVRASLPTPAMAASADADDWRTSWPSAHEVVDVPGDHLTMMREHAETTVSAIRTWIQGRTAKAAS